MSKANQIRKKALDLVRKQNWEGAIREFRRLAEIDQSNPNVFNELGDVYLKTGNRTDAYDAFQKAIDAYTRVSLYNNAVAVCKKVLRLLPARFEVLVKLGEIRARQGLWREAESYFTAYLDRVAGEPAVDPEDVARRADAILEHGSESTTVLERLADTLTGLSLAEPLGRTLAALHGALERAGERERAGAVRARLVEMGLEALLPQAQPSAPDGVVITEDNIWDAEHSEGERIAVETTPAGTDGVTHGATDAAATRAADPAHDYGTVELGAAPAAETTANASEGASADGGTATATAVETAAPVGPSAPADADGAAAPGAGAASPGDAPGAADGKATPPGSDRAPELSGEAGGPAESIAVSALLGEDGDDDGRSHYDLGMAYTEMELWPDAIREFQLASRSPALRARALEMIGHCFLQMGQARLAIKRLEMGLREVPEERDAIGIKYNLGLAYEMVGDAERARSMFEDVYVLDVAFRDVAAKMRHYGA